MSATNAAPEFTIPNQKVLSVDEMVDAQYCLRKMGKKAAMTVVAKAELPTSYSAHAHSRVREKEVTISM